jgi:hypothetical protein
MVLDGENRLPTEAKAQIENKRVERDAKVAVEDWKLRTPNQRRAIKNVAAWLTDRHSRALVELQEKTA